MKRNRIIRSFKKLHRWPAVVIAFFAITFAFSGIFMNHRELISSVDISRKFLPDNYAYRHWNLASVRGSVPLESNSMLIYGNIGVWKCDGLFQNLEDFNQGFPKGIDNRKIYSIVKFGSRLFAGTHMGLYSRNLPHGEWRKTAIPVEAERIADLGLKQDTLLVLTRHYLLSSTNGDTFIKRQLPAPAGYERKAGLFNTLWELHSGELFGLGGKLFVDLLGLVTILLSVTGLLHFFFPKIIRKRKKSRKESSGLIRTKKKNLKWHNVAGYIFVLFLVINTTAGMFLRPPLLIAIANSKVGIIPFTHMDSPNAWFDKLRRVHWDEESEKYIFSTSDGIFFGEENLTAPLIQASSQPPVSIMGCNVFKSLGNNNYLVGSFSGMFLWNTRTGGVYDFFTQQPYRAPQGMARPIASNMVTGIVEGNHSAYWFDYNRGALPVSGNRLPEFPRMPEEITEKSPMSLWNVSLEIHTGRIFESLVGAFYILYVPLCGICILLVLLSGFFLWWMAYKKRK